MKKHTLWALVAVIIVQLLTPAYMIAHRYDILRRGEEFRFIVAPVDPYDAFRGRYVYLNSPQATTGYGKYGIIAVDGEGFAYIREIADEKPSGVPYVKSAGRNWFSLPISRYYMDEKLAPKAESYTRQRSPERESYVTVRVKNGELVVSGLYVGGEAIEDIVRD